MHLEQQCWYRDGCDSQNNIIVDTLATVAVNTVYYEDGTQLEGTTLDVVQLMQQYPF